MNASHLRDQLAARQQTIDTGLWLAPSEIAANYDAYVDARRWCAWRAGMRGPRYKVERDLEAYRRQYRVKYAPNPLCNPMCEHDHPVFGSDTTGSNLCSVGGNTGGHDSASSWHIHRLGPIISRGGTDWHTVRHSDMFELGGDKLGGAMYVIAVFLAVVDEDGHLLGNPPIRIHHAHLGVHSIPGIQDFVAPLAFAHDETGCAPQDGGMACHLFTFPPGHGIALSQPLLLNVLVSDVRAGGSPPLKWAVEASLRLTRAPQRRLGLWYSSGAAEPPPNGPAAAVADSQAAIAPDMASALEWVTWATTKSALSGRVIDVRHRVHETQGFREMWLMGAAPQEVGLESGLFSMSRYACA